MGKRKNASTRAKETMFFGDSKELKHHLTKKKQFLTETLKDKKGELTSEQKKKVNAFIDAIDDMLRLKYFISRKTYTMPDLIEDIKDYRGDLFAELEKVNLELTKYSEALSIAMEDANDYIANEYEDEYMSVEQIALRKAIEEYQETKWEYDSIENCRKALWHLLGVIHRPVGFFSKVFDAEEE